MLDLIKSKIQIVQTDLSSGIKSLANRRSSSLSGLSTESLDELNINPEAGAELLSRYQRDWASIQKQNEENFIKADVAARELDRVHNRISHKTDTLCCLSREIACLPRLAEDLSSLVTDVACIEGLCEEVETALAYLEVIRKTQDLQDKKLEQRFQLALYREHKMAQLEETKSHLTLNYLHKAEKKAKDEKLRKQERQQLAAAAFEDDMNLYRSTGSAKKPASCHQLSVSMPNPDLHLSDVELEYDHGDLEDFLGGPSGGSSTDKHTKSDLSSSIEDLALR